MPPAPPRRAPVTSPGPPHKPEPPAPGPGPERATQVRQQGRSGRGGHSLTARRGPARHGGTAPGPGPGKPPELPPQPAAEQRDGTPRNTAGRRAPSSRTARGLPHPPGRAPPRPAPPSAGGRHQGRRAAAIGRPGRPDHHAHRLLLRALPHRLRPARLLGPADTPLSLARPPVITG